MINENEIRQATKERYGFESWPTVAEPKGVGARPGIAPEALPLPHLRRQAIPGGGYVDAYGDGKETLVTVWVLPASQPGLAREALIDYLMRCTAPHPLPDAAEKGLACGEVAFTGLDDPATSLVFVRGRHLVRIHSVGDKPYDLKGFAEALDGMLMAADP